MPKYTYTGDFPRLLTGLIQGTNAHHGPADGAPSDLVDGQTIVVQPGDTVDTGDEPYIAFQLVDADAPDELPAAKAPTAPVAASKPAPVEPAPDAAPAPEAPATVPAPTF